MTVGIKPYKESDWIKTNAYRIRAMTDKELAEYHAEMCGCPPGHDPIFCGMATIGCVGCWHGWLKQEAAE